MEDMVEMDQNLEQAAISGNVDFLIETIITCQTNNNDYSCLLSRSAANNDETVGNIFHLAAWNGKQEFFKQAINRIPAETNIVARLLSQQEPNGVYPNFNPLHVAAFIGHLEIVKLILGFYSSVPDTVNLSKPWLARDAKGLTPLHLAIQEKKEDCALEILSINPELSSLCIIHDNSGNSPLFLAVRHGCSHVALKILTDAQSYSVQGKDGSILHYLPNCSGEVCTELLKKHSQLIKAIDHEGYTILQRWVKMHLNSDPDKSLWPLQHLINSSDINITDIIKKELFKLIRASNRDGDNPFHIAAHNSKSNASKILVKVYEEGIAKWEGGLVERKPWLTSNKKGQTPMELALNGEALKWYSATVKENSLNQPMIESIFLAIKEKQDSSADQIWNTQLLFGWSKASNPDGRDIWNAALRFSEEAAIWMANKMPFLIERESVAVKLTLKSVIDQNASCFLKWMMEKYPSVLKDEPETWVEACKGGHYSTVLTCIDNCSHFREICIVKKNTPLHCIKFNDYEQYQKFLKHPVMLGFKNYQDETGATPLHQAITNKNIKLTEVLLNLDDVDRSIKDKEHRKPMDLLAQLSKKDIEWMEMCKRNGIIPGYKTTYFQDKNSLLEFRQTLSVVAALLATITFTAGFTVPGGFDNSSGEALLADKAAFSVFILSDAFSMCCSMIMLVFLMSSMVSDRQTSLIWMDRSVPVLIAALYSSILAFMTGVYIVIRHKSYWASIVIIIMCSIFLFLPILYLYPDRFKPKTCKCGDIEQGEASGCGGCSMSWITGKVFNCSFGLCNSQQQKSE